MANHSCTGVWTSRMRLITSLMLAALIGGVLVWGVRAEVPWQPQATLPEENRQVLSEPDPLVSVVSSELPELVLVNDQASDVGDHANPAGAALSTDELWTGLAPTGADWRSGGPEVIPSGVGSLLFIENVGQFAEPARFLVQGSGASIWLTEDAIWLTMIEEISSTTQAGESSEEFGSGESGSRSERASRGRMVRQASVKLTFAGASAVRLEPFDRSATHFSYYLGNDPAEWHENVPAWHGVRYVGIYPGMDLVITGDGGRWDWEIVCRHSCRTAVPQVKLELQGPGNLTTNRTGVEVETAVGRISLPALKGARLTNENSATSRPPGSARLVGLTLERTASGTATLAKSVLDQGVATALNSLGAANSPTSTSALLWGTYLGGSDDDNVNDITFDDTENVYVAGETYSEDFPTSTGVITNSSQFSTNAFIAKLSADGSTLVYVTVLGSYEEDGVGSIESDGSGQIYMVGGTTSPLFPSTPDAYSTATSGNSDCFVARLSVTGTLQYSTFIGGEFDECYYDDTSGNLVLDDEGKVLVTGFTDSDEFPTTDQSNCGASSDYDAFVFVLDPSIGGTGGLLYSTCMGGPSHETYPDLAANDAGDIFLVGTTYRFDGFKFNGSYVTATHTITLSTCTGAGPHAFTARLDRSLGGDYELRYVACLELAVARGIAIGADDSAFFTGVAYDSDFPVTPGAYDTEPDSDEAFVVKVAPDGSSLDYATFLGGSSFEYGLDIAVDSAGRAYVLGATVSDDFPVTAGALASQYGGIQDSFLAILNPSGTNLEYATYIGGGYREPYTWHEYDCAIGIAISRLGKVGLTFDTESDNIFGVASGHTITNTEAFIAVLDLHLPTILPPDATWGLNECPFCSTGASRHDVGGPINTRTGNLHYDVQDLSIAALGDPLYFERSYNAQSTGLYTMPLGVGWTHNYDISLIFPSDLGGEPSTVILKAKQGSRLRFTDNGDGTFTPWPAVWGTLTRTLTAPYTYTVTGVDQSIYTFDADGNLTAVENPLGHTTSLSYTNGRLARVADATGERYLDFTYNAIGRLRQVQDPLGRTVSYGYDAEGDDLVIVTDTRGLTWTYAYSTPHLLAQVRDPQGNLIEHTEYDTQSRAVRQWTAASPNPLMIDYGTTVVITDALGNVTVDGYSVSGVLTAQGSDSGVSSRTYDENFNWTSTTDANGNSTAYDFTSMGLPEVITDALNADTRIAYDTANHPTQIEDARGNTTTYDYEGNRLITTTDALDGVVINTYNDDGLLICSVSRGLTTTYAYDAWGQRTAVTDTAGLVTRYEYDAVGRLITATTPTGLVTVNDYDDGDNLIQVTRNTTTTGGQNYLGLYNQVTEHGYDAVGRRTHVTDTLGLVTYSEYDAAGRLIRTTRNYSPSLDLGNHGPGAVWNLSTQYGYDALGRQTHVTDTLGHVTYTEYDHAGRPLEVTRNYSPTLYPAHGPATTWNLTTTYGYDAVGNQTHVTDTLGGVTYTEYDDLNRVLRTWRNYLPGSPQNHQDTYNLVTTYGYDAVGNQVWVTDTQGLRTYTQYDVLNRPVTVTTNYVDGAFDPDFPDEDLIQITVYDAETGRLTLTRDPASRFTHHAYDAAGRVVTVTTNYVDGVFDPARPDEDVQQVTVYDPVTGRVTARLRVAGTAITTTYTYDVLGRLVATTDALSGTTTTEYDVLGRRSRTCDAEGACTRYAYDVAGRLVTTTNALSGTLVTTYDALGRRVAQTNPLGYTSVYTYNGAGRLVSQRDPEDGVTHYGYDALGRGTVVTDADGVAVYSVYNALGQLTATSDALGNTTSYAYDALGRRTVMTDANTLATHYEYDDQGRLTAVTEGYVPGAGSDADTNVRTEYAYDVLGSLRVITDALNHTTVYTYDLAGRRVAEADGLGHVTRYTYDGHGRRTAVMYPDVAGVFTVTTGYNALGWATEVVYPGVGDVPGFTVSYGYNKLGHREAVTDATGTMAYDYDVLYRPLDIAAPTGAVTYTFNAAGQRTHLIYPTGETVTCTHDAAGRLLTVIDWDGGVTVYTYTAAGRLSALARPNGVTSAYRYDDAGRLVEIEHRDGSDTLLARYTYTLDGVGNRTGVTETVLTPSGTQAAVLGDAGPGLAMSLLPDAEPADTPLSVGRVPGLARLLTPAPQEAVETDDLPPDWLAQIAADLAASEYEVTWQDAAYQAPNRAHNLRTRFDADGIRVTPRTGADWELGLTLTQVGYDEGRMRSVPAGTLTAQANGVVYTRDGLSEWYVNDARGVEQGFVVSAPSAAGAETLALDLTFSGTLTATLADTQIVNGRPSGTAIDFTSPDGARVLRYGGLRVTDATGRELDARLVPLSEGEVVDLSIPQTSPVLTEAVYASNPAILMELGPFTETPLPPFDGVRIAVDVTGAVFPVVVDPVLTSPEWTVESNHAGAQLGWSVASAGDVDNNGYADVIVGAYKYDVTGKGNAGWVGVYLGSAAGITTTGAWSATGAYTDTYFGYSVASAGDVNHDGYDDVIVGAPQQDGGATGSGQVYVYLGSAHGITLTGMLTLTIPASNAGFGGAVGTAGDVNGDLYADVIIGAYLYDGAYTDEGAAYVYLGSSNGITTTGVWSTTGGQTGARLGVAVGTAADVDNDSYDDIIIGAESYDILAANGGRVYVYRGSSSGITTDGLWTMNGAAGGAWFGHAVGTAGDVNGDDYADIIVGAPYQTGGATQSGQVAVCLGSSAGITTTGVWTATVAQANAYFGGSVGTAGDVNGDGYADVIVGAMTYADGQAGEGAAFVYTGASGGLSPSPNSSVESNLPNTRFGISVGTAGDVNGDGADDIIVGAYGYSGPQNGEGRAYVYHGTPVTDTAISGLIASNDSPTGLGQPTTLTATVSTGTLITYTWAFGDGVTGSGATVTHTYPHAGSYTAVVTAANSVNTVTATTTVTITGSGPVTVTRTITYTYDNLHRLTGATYSTVESYVYQYDRVGNRLALTSTTPLSGTVVTTYTYDAANRLTGRAVSDGRSYTYTWSDRGQLLAEVTQGYPVRTFTYDAAGQLVRATVFTLNTEFVYNGLGARVAVSVAGQMTAYALDYAVGSRILAETTPTSTVQYLYGDDCLGEERDEGWLHYLPDAEGYVRQGTDTSGAVVSAWLFDPDGTLLEGPEGPVSHLVCGGVYDLSTGLIYRDGRYFDPMLGIWLALVPLLWYVSKPQRKGGHPWLGLVCIGVLAVTTLTGCPRVPLPDPTPTVCVTIPTLSPSPSPKPCPSCDTLPVSNSELPFERELWNDGAGIQLTNNCYSYAANDRRIHHSDFGLPQPGVAGGLNAPMSFPIERERIRVGAIRDGFLVHDCETSCPAGYYKTMAFISATPSGRGDYHFYRQDAGGCWSHKPGAGPVTNTDFSSSGSLIGDPRSDCVSRSIGEASYLEFCDCFCVKSGTRTEVYVPGAPAPL